MQEESHNFLKDHENIERLERIVAALIEGMVQRVTFAGEPVSFEEAASRDCALPLMIAQAELWSAPLMIQGTTSGIGCEPDDNAIFGSTMTVQADSDGNVKPFNIALLNVIAFVLHNAVGDSPQGTLELTTLTRPQLPRVFHALDVKRWPSLRAPKQERQPTQR